MRNNITDINTALATKDFIENATTRIGELENALYMIMEAERLDLAKEISAEVLGEDLDSYLEEDDLEELDFEDDTNVDWESIDGLSEE